MFEDVVGPSNSWPAEVEEGYERIEVLGKGSFGTVWMSRRLTEPKDEFDDEYTAVKCIMIKDEKSKVYAEREIAILKEVRHPNVIRLIRAYPVYHESRVVILQLARGPNLHQLVIKRGALGLSLSRLVSRQLIAAVSYLHGRAVLHRDIKPSNCILACNTLPPTEFYDWIDDGAIWDNGQAGQDAVASNKWKLMLVDFGFARALEQTEISSQARHLRNSIVFEKGGAASPVKLGGDPVQRTASTENKSDSDNSDVDDHLNELVEKAAMQMRRTSFQATNAVEQDIMGEVGTRKRLSGVSMPVIEDRANHRSKRLSTARKAVRSMSALGTKAYAAPEIRKKLRHKTVEDFEKANAAMTECVADYGMIVDAYSVGWTIRVAMTGIPPNFTMSEYMDERDVVVISGTEEEEMTPSCCCFGNVLPPTVRIRDPATLPKDATLMITKMIEKNPEDRMTVREAQNHPWIAGGPNENHYDPPQGDVPSLHGDPVVPLKCATELSQITVEYHMQ